MCRLLIWIIALPVSIHPRGPPTAVPPFVVSSVVRLLDGHPAPKAGHSKTERDEQQEDDHQRADGPDALDVALVPHIPYQDGENLVLRTLIEEERFSRYPHRMQH